MRKANQEITDPTWIYRKNGIRPKRSGIYCCAETEN